jgi:hypothetical protein
MLQNAGTFTVLGKSEAATSGLSRFYTGIPCRDGHQSERYVSNRQCIACNAAKARHREQLRGVRDPSFRMYRNVLRRTGMALRGRASPANAVGCEHAKLRDHIAAQFRMGMCWERYRQWEVDHVKPLSSAQTLSELIALCHFSNTQPLWRGENLRKGGA